jgi:hypothetical protein
MAECSVIISKITKAVRVIYAYFNLYGKLNGM